MTVTEWATAGSCLIAAIMALYIIVAPSPKETSARMGKIEVEMASLQELLRGTIRTVDRLARIVDNYLENRAEHTGRSNHR